MLRHPPPTSQSTRLSATASVDIADLYRPPAAPNDRVARRPRRHGLRRDLAFSLGDAALFSVMVGLGETYIGPFVLALGGGEIASGLVTALPLLAGAILQLATPFAVRKTGSHKRWVVACATTQAASLLMMPVAAYFGHAAVGLVFVAATMYWGAGLATGPAWNTWIEGLVPRRVRTRFFAGRVRISQVCILIGFVAGGFSLQSGKLGGHALLAFGMIFLVSAASRFASAWLLARQREPLRHRLQERYVTVRQLMSGEKSEAGAKLLAYLFAVQVAVFISGPYFVPFMISKMKMSYHVYALLIGLTFVGKVVALPFWGRLAHFAGPHKLLWIGGMSIIPISGLWVLMPQSQPYQYLYLGLLQLLGGVTWAAFELAVFLMFFETIPREERTSVLTIYNFGNSVAQVVGAVIGAVLLQLWGKTTESYLWLFVLSSVARATTLGFLSRVPNVRLRLDAPIPMIGTVSAGSGDEGTIDQPILASISDDPPR